MKAGKLAFWAGGAEGEVLSGPKEAATREFIQEGISLRG
jgi:hypothetical protein